MTIAKPDCFCNHCQKDVKAEATTSAYSWGRCAECGTTNVEPICPKCNKLMEPQQFPGAYKCDCDKSQERRKE